MQSHRKLSVSVSINPARGASVPPPVNAFVLSKKRQRGFCGNPTYSGGRVQARNCVKEAFVGKKIPEKYVTRCCILRNLCKGGVASVTIFLQYGLRPQHGLHHNIVLKLVVT